jgi:methionine aminopeptidase type II
MININNLSKKPNFQNLSNKQFNPCLTIGHHNKDINKDINKNIKLSNSDMINELRKAAECHKMVRYQLQNYIKPGMKIYDICNFIEKSVVENFGQNNLNEGIGFPVGYSINNCIAHDTASPTDNRILNFDDVVKIDYGTHVNGRIIDSAFTLAYNPKFSPLLEATKEATWSAIKMLGPDTYVNDISQVIDEVITSYEIELDGKTYDIKPVATLGGHNIRQYIIHAGTIILCKPNDNQLVQTMRIKEGECYAIETFASTGTGNFTTESDNNLYSLKQNYNKANFKLDITGKLLNHIKNTHNTLPFCSRWLFDKFGIKYKMGINELVKNGIINEYPPLCDIKNSYSSQLEHTIYVHEYGKEVVSFGEDY